MATRDNKVTETTTQVPTDSSAVSKATDVKVWHRLALVMVLLIADFLNFYRLRQIGYGNAYYAAAVKSMLINWHNFFFVSFDPSGFVTIDKPPLGFWIQVLSAKLFGFSGLSLLLPEALAGVLSVALLYYLVRRIFGPTAGLLAALALALMPINVVANRSNIVDSLLVLTMLLAAWAISRAAETGHLRWLLLCALITGLGFNTKMLQAYLVLPAFGLMYLFGAPLRWRTRIGHLTLATVVLVIISLSWSVAVDLTPASQRPYVGSSTTNSELNLAFGYNGLERITGLLRRDSRPPANTVQGERTSQQISPVFAGETGAPGPLRLLNEQLGGQVSWLLPLAVLSMLAVAWQAQPRLSLDRRQQALMLWGIWLLTMGTFFSIAGFFHTYYLVMLAPAICALAGIGVVVMWQDYRRPGWRGWLLPVVLVITAAMQAYLLLSFPEWSRRLTPLVVGLCLLAADVLVMARLISRLHLVRGPAVAMGMLALLIAPTAWSAISVMHGNSSSMIPIAGPRQQNNPFMGAFGGSGQGFSSADARLEDYLRANQGQARFLTVTLNAISAAPLILDTGKPVMAVGGFIGSDHILTSQQFVTLVNNGSVRFVLLPSLQLNELPPWLREFSNELSREDGDPFSQGGSFLGQNSDLTQWVSNHCTAVPSNLWQSEPPGSGTPPGFGERIPEQLFDCANHH